jgi:hypothetical protein
MLVDRASSRFLNWLVIAATGLVVAATGAHGAFITAPTLDTFVLYGERSVKIGQDTTVSGGNVGVLGAAPTVFGVQLTLDDHVTVDKLHNLFSPTIAVGLQSTAGDVQANKVTHNGGAIGPAGGFPFSTMPPLPLRQAALATSGQAVTIASGTSSTLSPGSYGALTVAGTITLAPGTYSFSTVTIADSGALHSSSSLACVGSPGPSCATEISVAGALVVGAHASVEPQFESPNPGNLTPQASALTITVAANDPSPGTPAAKIGSGGKVRALLAAPGGTLSIDDEVEAVGAFSAFDVVVGNHVNLTFEVGLRTPPPAKQQLTGYYGPSPNPNVAPLSGPIPLTSSIDLDIGLPVRDGENGERLRAAVRAVSDPHSPSYRHYLTQAEFTEQYGASDADYDQLIAWAKSSGFAIVKTFPNRLMLAVHGNVAQIEQALHANLVLRQRYDGSSFVTVDREPSIDLTLPILRIGGLDDFVVPTSQLSTNGSFAVSGQANAYAAADLRAAYLGVGSTCQTLTGVGQVIGIFSFQDFNQTDITAYDGLQIPPINPANILPSTLIAGGPIQFGAGSTIEAWLDIEMAQAMAPNAKIAVFENDIYSNLFNFGHADAAFHAMATSTPQLTVASNSWDLGRDGSEQQALYQMAMQGVSFFDASGDSGSADDPQDFRDLDAITLVGGTFLNTNPLTSGTPPYPNPYYLPPENTWNKVAFGLSSNGGATQGGVMNGTQNLPEEGLPVFVSFGDFPACGCFPYPFCCGPPIPIPYYQSQVPFNGGPAGNLGQFRTYPDVAMAASNLGIVANATTQASGGTSGAAPLWAGFMALANELSVSQHAGLIGFANPVLYALGITSGSSPDLYKACFNDINDGVSNGRFGDPGYKSVPGYDMATGWGSPTCGLIHQLATTTPLTPNIPLPYVDFLITTGHDDLRPTSAAEAVVQFANGKSATLPLRQQGVEWNNGAMAPLTFDLRNYLCATPSTCLPTDLPTQATGIVSLTINMLEGTGGPTFADNWDISGLHVRLYPEIGGDIQEACQFDLAGNNRLQDGHLGLVRLSSTVSSSGIGPQVTFSATGAPAASFLVGTHCARTGSPLPASGPPVPSGVQFIFSTGSDDLRKDSGLQAQAFDAANHVLATWQLKNSGAGSWDNDTEQDIIVPLASGAALDHITLTLQQHGSFPETSDKWNIDGVDIVTWNSGGAEVCFFNQQPSSFANDTPVMEFQNNPVIFKLTGCRGGQ